MITTTLKVLVTTLGRKQNDASETEGKYFLIRTHQNSQFCFEQNSINLLLEPNVINSLIVRVKKLNFGYFFSDSIENSTG